MALDPNNPAPCAVQGQILRLSERRETAIYLRDGKLWVADFIDGRGELIDAATWFRFNCGSRASPHARRRMAIDSAIPLYEQLEKRIDVLHHSGATRSLYAHLEQRIHQPHRSDSALTMYAQLGQRIQQRHRSTATDIQTDVKPREPKLRTNREVQS
jgi:hypothetical protein